MTKINLDKLQASKVGNIESIIADVVLPNGSLVAIDEAVTGERELQKVKTPALADEVLLVASVEMHYDTLYADQLDYTLPIGETGRAYHLTIGDKFQVEQTMFAATPNKGDIVEVNPATLGYTAVTTGARVTFLVEALTLFGYAKTPMARLRVLTV